MEDILDVYARPYNPNIPLICMDESNKQLLGEVREPLQMRSGSIKKIDDEYRRNGVADIFIAVEPLRGKRIAEVTKTRTRKDWAWFIKKLIDEVYPQAERILLVMDNLNTHTIASLYETFSPAIARRLSSKLEIHYTPKHGSWLNIAEIELSVLARQCLSCRIATFEEMKNKIHHWEMVRNCEHHKIDWQFTTADARIKLKSLYPTLTNY